MLAPVPEGERPFPAGTTGGYFYHLKRREPNPEARDIALQDRLIDIYLQRDFRGRPAAHVRTLWSERNHRERAIPVWCVAL